jgi:hypothetical protein
LICTKEEQDMGKWTQLEKENIKDSVAATHAWVNSKACGLFLGTTLVELVPTILTAKRGRVLMLTKFLVNGFPQTLVDR